MIALLTRDDFLKTFCEPMRRLEADESFRTVPLGSYVDECIRELNLPTNRKEIEIHHVYVSGDNRHTHVLMFFGQHNRYLVVVAAHPSDTILGHHLLDLNEEYGMDQAEQDAGFNDPSASAPGS